MTEVVEEPGAVSISDTTLKEQESLKIKPQKDRMDRYIKDLQSEDEDVIRSTCDALAHVAFIPWLNKQNQANKIYFAKRGGILLCVKWMREATKVQTKAAAGTAVWNFSEAGPMHAILWNQGAVDALLEFLKSSEPNLQKVAIGALFGLLDYDSNTGANISARHDKDLVQRVYESEQAVESWSFSLAKIGCLLCLAKHSTTRAELIKLGGIKKIQSKNSDPLISYLNSLYLAHLLTGDESVCSPEKRRKCLNLISEEFLRTPRSVRDKESQHGVVWTSARHLGRLLVDNETVLRHMGLFSLANLSYGDYNRSLILEEDMLGHVMCMQWIDEGKEANERKSHYIEIIAKNFGPVVTFPTLFQICIFHIFNKYSYLLPHLEEYEDTLIPRWIRRSVPLS